MSAALKLFETVGYEHASTRVIAKAARVSEVTLFRHFGSKKNLLSESIGNSIVQNYVVKVTDSLTGIYANDILSMAHMEIETTAANLDLLRLLACDARNVPEINDVLTIGREKNLNYLRVYFQRQIDRRIIRAGLSAMELAVTFRNMFSSSLLFDNLFQEGSKPQLPDEDMIRAQVDIFIQGTRA